MADDNTTPCCFSVPVPPDSLPVCRWVANLPARHSGTDFVVHSAGGGHEGRAARSCTWPVRSRSRSPQPVRGVCPLFQPQRAAVRWAAVWGVVGGCLPQARVVSRTVAPLWCCRVLLCSTSADIKSHRAIPTGNTSVYAGSWIVRLNSMRMLTMIDPGVRERMLLNDCVRVCRWGITRAVQKNTASIGAERSNRLAPRTRPRAHRPQRQRHGPAAVPDTRVTTCMKQPSRSVTSDTEAHPVPSDSDAWRRHLQWVHCHRLSLQRVPARASALLDTRYHIARMPHWTRVTPHSTATRIIGLSTTPNLRPWMHIARSLACNMCHTKIHGFRT